MAYFFSILHLRSIRTIALTEYHMTSPLRPAEYHTIRSAVPYRITFARSFGLTST